MKDLIGEEAPEVMGGQKGQILQSPSGLEKEFGL